MHALGVFLMALPFIVIIGMMFVYDGARVALTVLGIVGAIMGSIFFGAFLVSH